MSNRATTGVAPRLVTALELLIPPPLYALGIGLAMWLLHQQWPVMTLVERPWNMAGAILMSVALVPAAAAFALFRRNRTSANPHHPEKARVLVTSGIFRWTRNPMYLSLLTLLLGWGLLLGSLSALTLPALFAALVTRLQIIPEERILASHFAEEFRDYAKRVRRWI